MTINELLDYNVRNRGDTNNFLYLNSNQNLSIAIYENSINRTGDGIFFIGKQDGEKFLYIMNRGENRFDSNFEGEVIKTGEEAASIKKCFLNKRNAEELQKLFPFTNPVLLGLNNSFGFGDRIGLANAAHIRSQNESDFKPVIAQQSIRELTRTERVPADVMSAAVWAVFQEGYKDGFGADADHLKTTEDIDLMITNGFTMFTFDPSEHVINEADSIPVDKLNEKIKVLPWESLNDNYDSMLKRYEKGCFDLGEGFEINPTNEEILRAAIKYSGAVAHINNLYKHLNNNYSDKPFEVEVSVDETESVTTPFEHFFIASELNRLNVKIISLAPRFIGDFEKGIDYKGDLEIFKEEYLKHVKVAEYFGSYKISLHSGSDKFGVYKAIGSLKRGYTHVKTAGTSYLEALRVVASEEPDLFREILDYSRDLYVTEKESYHVSADINNVSASKEYEDKELLDLFNQDDARQVLHVTFGKVLTIKNNDGGYIYKERIYECLNKNEDVHYNYIIKHFKKHLDPFK